MGEDDSARSNKRVELLLSANGAGGKEVYEYTPDPGSVVSHASSSPDGIDKGDAHRSLRGAKEIDDTEVRPSTAYEFFRGKTYKSTAFQNGFSTRRAWRGSSSGVMEVRGQRTVLSAYKGDKVSDIGSMSSTVSEFREASSFETPIARLRRLQSEVEEMLDFVSSFLVEERVHLPKGVGTEGAEPEKAAPSDEVSAEQGESSKSTGLLQVQYQARRLSQGAKEALLFGNDPLSLIEELKRLRMQVSSVLSDKKTEALVSHIEPVTGMRSGAALLAQHLSTASTQLQQVLANEAEALSLPSKNSAATSAVAVRVGDAQPAASGGVTAGDGGAELASTAYEVYCVPSLSPMIEQSRITFLERRLALVENKMGLHKMSLLPHADLFEAVNEMQQRIKLLDAQKIESLQKRVQGLLLELHALQQRRHELDMAAEGVSTPAYGASVGSGGEYGRGRNAGAPAAASDWQRVEELYDICERWKAPAAVLPSVLQRLKLLKGIHQEAGGVSVRLSVLEKQQEELQAWVKRADEAVTQLQKTVLESIEWAQRTVSQMQQRLVAVDASATTDT
ncbi:dynactin subunit 2 [Cyclospora cayetanensis]|uniref:Dynactin subunit 2 n=1 Tax=Cyclospora cayetanensis TaxID=88456 RepID=A0A6P6RY88_9EIME|nr:dynactin subunit 2 [Cyclospora cayetanensis]